MNVSTSSLDAAFDAAIASAQSLGDSVVPISPIQIQGISDGTTQTIQTEVLNFSPDGVTVKTGFRVTAKIQIAGVSFIRIYETLPQILVTQWPSDFSVAISTALAASIAQGKIWISSQGFDSTDLVTMLNLFMSSLTAAGGNLTTLAASKPIICAVYQWTQTVQTMAAQGYGQFPSSPYTFQQVISESFPL